MLGIISSAAWFILRLSKVAPMNFEARGAHHRLAGSGFFWRKHGSQELELRQHEIRQARISTIVDITSALIIAVVSNIVVVMLTAKGLDQTARQFDLSSKAGDYNDIIQGFDSDSEAIQINSVRRLRTFIQDDKNFSDDQRQQDEARDAIYTLVAFVKERQASTGDGLRDFNEPHSTAALNALSQLNTLVGDEHLGKNWVDLARVDMHGIVNLKGFHPTSGVFMRGVDLRRADLEKLNLAAAPADLQRSFLTCANLRDANLGEANLGFADLSGANLSGADLSQVEHLDRRQLTGVIVDAQTRLPEGVTPPAMPEWTENDCIQYAKDMTGLAAGAGYDEKLPCPGTLDVCLARSP